MPQAKAPGLGHRQGKGIGSEVLACALPAGGLHAGNGGTKAKAEGKASMAKHIFVTGVVVSFLDKGITVASLGHLLKVRGCKVTMQKMDPDVFRYFGSVNLPDPRRARAARQS